MDSGVNLVAFARMDGCPVSQPQPFSSWWHLIDDKAQVGCNDVAIKKARTAALFRLPFLPWFTWTCCTFQKKKYRGARYFTELVGAFFGIPAFIIDTTVLNICQERVGRVREEDLAWTAGMQLLIFFLAAPGVVHQDRELFGENSPSWRDFIRIWRVKVLLGLIRIKMLFSLNRIKMLFCLNRMNSGPKLSSQKMFEFQGVWPGAQQRRFDHLSWRNPTPGCRGGLHWQHWGEVSSKPSTKKIV